MTWQLSLILWYVFTIAQSLWQRSYAQKSELPESFPPALSYILAVTPLSIVVGLLMPHGVHWSPWLVFLLVSEGILIALFNWLMFVALRRLPVARFQMIFQLYAVVVILLGWTFLQETLSLMQVAGGVLLFAAAFIAIRAPKKNEEQLQKRADLKAVLVTIAASVALGVGLVIEKAALNHMAGHSARLRRVNCNRLVSLFTF